MGDPPLPPRSAGPRHSLAEEFDTIRSKNFTPYETTQWFTQAIRDHGHTLPTISVEDVREAAMAFSPSPAVGMEDTRHRQVALLPGQAFAVLGKLFTACERLGSTAPSLFVNLITFLVMPTGGVRSVGIISTFFSLHEQVSLQMARRTEGAVAMRVSTVAVMVDLLKCLRRTPTSDFSRRQCVMISLCPRCW